METITSLASTATTAASKLIYGDQTQNNETAGKEPVSGEKGSGTATDPYDQGNAATPLAAADKTDYVDSSNNETAGKEPVSGVLGSGTATEPFDQGNNAKATENAADKTSGSDAFLKLDPVHQTQAPADTAGAASGSGPKSDTSNVGMPVLSLAPDTAVLSSGTAPTETETTGVTDKVWKENPLDDISRSGAPGAGPEAPSHVTSATETAGVTDKVWKENPLDDISRSGAPGAGPEAPDHVVPATPGTAANTATSPDTAIKTAAPDSVTASSGLYSGSETQRSETGAGLDSKAEAEKESEKRDTPAWTDTGVPSDSSKYEEDVARQNAASPKESKSVLEKETSPKSESAESNEEKGGKMSHLKEKMKNKLHIGSKDK